MEDKTVKKTIIRKVITVVVMRALTTAAYGFVVWVLLTDYARTPHIKYILATVCMLPMVIAVFFNAVGTIVKLRESMPYINNITKHAADEANRAHLTKIKK